MKQKLFALFGAFIVLVNTVFSLPLQVYASSGLDGFENWSNGEKFYYYSTHFIPIATQCVGVVFSPSLLMWDNWLCLFEEYESDRIVASGCSSYEDYIATKMHLNDDGELVIDDDLADAIYNTTNIYLEEYTGWYNITTQCHTELQAVDFSSKEHYSTVKTILSNDLGDNGAIPVLSLSFSMTDDSEDGLKYGVSRAETFDITEYMFVCQSYDETNDIVKYNRYNENWELDVIGDGTYTFYEYLNNEIEMHTSNQWVHSWYGYSYISTRDYTTTGLSQYNRTLFTSTPRQIRVYKTVEDMKSYSVGQRTYYATSQYYNYDTSKDNTCNISDSQLNGSSVYGDVTNIIINNYTDPDGLTEDELREILDDYFGNGNGSGDDSDNGSGSGSGLGDLLDGLGSVGNAIMSILGKLLEYIGKALDLISGTVTKVIDIIPKNITNLLGAIFPFFPQEWLTAIELGLVLAVIVGIVGLFKK